MNFGQILEKRLARFLNRRSPRVGMLIVGTSFAVLTVSATADARPVEIENRTVLGVPVRLAKIDLSDRKTVMNILLANDAPRANTGNESFGDESFPSMVKRAKAAVVINGTFFSKDDQKRVMGNMVISGVPVKYSEWENMGTTFGLRRDNSPELVTARTQHKPAWAEHWLSVTSGPRLLKAGEVWIHPSEEGFTDPALWGVRNRNALGYTRDRRTLLLVCFLKAVSLEKEAAVMKSLGAHEAMNLDGGASQGFAVGNRILKSPGRQLTNALVVYDENFPPSTALAASWQQYNRNGSAEADSTGGASSPVGRVDRLSLMPVVKPSQSPARAGKMTPSVSSPDASFPSEQSVGLGVGGFGTGIVYREFRSPDVGFQIGEGGFFLDPADRMLGNVHFQLMYRLLDFGGVKFSANGFALAGRSSDSIFLRAGIGPGISWPLMPNARVFCDVGVIPSFPSSVIRGYIFPHAGILYQFR